MSWSNSSSCAVTHGSQPTSPCAGRLGPSRSESEVVVDPGHDGKLHAYRVAVNPLVGNLVDDDDIIVVVVIVVVVVVVVVVTVIHDCD
jgi:hypothetical protein